MDILTRLFPIQKRNVLENVLRDCGGDLAQAIECILEKHEEATRQRMYPAPTFHHMPSPLSFVSGSLPPYTPLPLPAIPMHPILTKSKCNCYNHGNVMTTPKLFSDVKATFPSYSFNFTTRDSAPYFRYPRAAFLPFPEKHENEYASVFSHDDTREHRDR